MQDKYNKLCPRCQSKLMKKLPKDKKQLSKVIRFFCNCGYYIDIPIDEITQYD